MKELRFFAWSVVLAVLIPCIVSAAHDRDKIEKTLVLLTKAMTADENDGRLSDFLKHYENDAISMPEYQVTLTGRREIETYYGEMFKRHQIKRVERTPMEFIHANNTVVVIGTFYREYNLFAEDSVRILEGKYCHVWSVRPDGRNRIRGETFGYFKPVDHPETLILSAAQQQIDESEVRITVPLELKAYNALMEKSVITRDGELRAKFYTDDAIYYPFADTAVSGIDQLNRYLISYSNRRQVTLDNVSCYTYAFEYLGEYVLEYAMFKVKWNRDGVAGKTEGKGIRIWRRQSDHSLKLFRQIGTHNYL